MAASDKRPYVKLALMRAMRLCADALPLSGAGKVLKTKLREPFWQGRERGVA